MSDFDYLAALHEELKEELTRTKAELESQKADAARLSKKRESLRAEVAKHSKLNRQLNEALGIVAKERDDLLEQVEERDAIIESQLCAGCEKKPGTELRESLAAYAHEAWSGWMRYLFGKCPVPLKHGGVIIPTNFVDRWQRQMRTDYSDLSEEEKNSDRIEADKMLAIVDGEIVRLKKAHNEAYTTLSGPYGSITPAEAEAAIDKARDIIKSALLGDEYKP